jgi:beta-hydroxylase
MDLLTRGVLKVLEFNEGQLDRYSPKANRPLDTEDFPWIAEIEADWEAIREEVDGLIEQRVQLPLIEDVTGYDQGNEGPWTTYILNSYGDWIDFNCERVPRTTELVKKIPGLQIAGFSVLGAGTHIPLHRGPNRGAFRYQLGIRIPEPAGSCRIKIGHEMFVWEERKSLIFDHSVHHEAWNDSDEDRFLLFVELLWPLPRRQALRNAATQRVFSLASRGLKERVGELEKALNG